MVDRVSLEGSLECDEAETRFNCLVVEGDLCALVSMVDVRLFTLIDVGVMADLGSLPLDVVTGEISSS